jgi:hypothetical protein
MDVWQKLPVEVWFLILEKVSPDHDLVSLALTCKDLWGLFDQSIRMVKLLLKDTHIKKNMKGILTLYFNELKFATGDQLYLPYRDRARFVWIANRVFDRIALLDLSQTQAIPFIPNEVYRLKVPIDVISIRGCSRVRIVKPFFRFPVRALDARDCSLSDIRGPKYPRLCVAVKELWLSRNRIMSCDLGRRMKFLAQKHGIQLIWYDDD